MRRATRILLFADSWAIFALGMIGPIYALFVADIGGDLLDASWAYFAFMLSSALAMFAVGHWEDHIKHKEKLITAGYALASVGCIMYIFVNSQLSLIATQIVIGIAEATRAPAYDSMYSEFLTKKKEASTWGDWEAMYYLATAFAALLGGYIVNGFGFKALFIVMFLFCFVSTLTSLGLFRNKRYLNKELKGIFK